MVQVIDLQEYRRHLARCDGFALRRQELQQVLNLSLYSHISSPSRFNIPTSLSSATNAASARSRSRCFASVTVNTSPSTFGST